MGLFKRWDRNLIGLDIGVSGIKAVEISGGESPRLLAYNRLPLPWDTFTNEGELQQREVVVAGIKKLFSSKIFSSKQVAVGLSGNSIITKKISVPKVSENDLADQLYWEAEQFIPFAINEVNLDFAILGDTPTPSDGTQAQKMMDVLLVAARKEYVQNILSLVAEAGLECTILDVQAFAMGNIFEFNHPGPKSPTSQTACLIDFGAGTTKLAFVEGDKTTFTRDLRTSGKACTLRIGEALGVAPAEAEKAKLTRAQEPAIQDLLQEFCFNTTEEVSRTIDFYLSQSFERSIEKIYICGGAAQTAGLYEALSDRMSAPVVQLNPLQNIAGSGKKISAQAVKEIGTLGSIALGLSLRKTGDCE